MRVVKLFLNFLVLTSVLFLITSCGGGDTNPVIPNPFSGSYEGTYTGTESGTWTGTVTTSGVFNVTIWSPSLGQCTGVGTVTQTGGVSLQTSGAGGGSGVTFNWTGSIDTSTHNCSGSWTSSAGYSGTWTGHET